jgi:hypothetical protein
MEKFKRELENYGYKIILSRFGLGELNSKEIRK